MIMHLISISTMVRFILSATLLSCVASDIPIFTIRFGTSWKGNIHQCFVKTLQWLLNIFPFPPRHGTFGNTRTPCLLSSRDTPTTSLMCPRWRLGSTRFHLTIPLQRNHIHDRYIRVNNIFICSKSWKKHCSVYPRVYFIPLSSWNGRFPSSRISKPF